MRFVRISIFDCSILNIKYNTIYGYEKTLIKPNIKLQTDEKNNYKK